MDKKAPSPSKAELREAGLKSVASRKYDWQGRFQNPLLPPVSATRDTAPAYFYPSPDAPVPPLSAHLSSPVKYTYWKYLPAQYKSRQRKKGNQKKDDRQFYNFFKQYFHMLYPFCYKTGDVLTKQSTQPPFSLFYFHRKPVRKFRNDWRSIQTRHIFL